MHHYDARVIADQATGRPLAGIRATLLDAETQTVVQAYRDGVPVTLVSGAHGLIGEFETEEATRRVHVTAGPVRLTMWCQELIGASGQAITELERLTVSGITRTDSGRLAFSAGGTETVRRTSTGRLVVTA